MRCVYVKIPMFLCLLGAWSAIAATKQAAAPRTHLPTEGWVEGKLQSMSLKEKLGQMLMIGFDGQVANDDILQQIRRDHIGSVILFARNINEASQTQRLLDDLQTQSLVELGIPLLVAVDQEGGQVDRLGGLLNQTLTRYNARTLGNLYAYAPQKAASLVEKSTEYLAQKMKQLGFNLNLAPVLDLSDDQKSYIYSRSYGGNPENVSQIAADYIEAMEKQGVATTGKHFPNLSQTRTDSHKDLPILKRSLTELEAYEFIPFRLLKNKLPAMMVGHVLIPSIDPQYPASISPKVVGYLRRQIAYQGVLISDDLKMRALSDRYAFSEVVLRSIFAGIDLLIIAGDKDKQTIALATLEYAVKRRHLSIQRVNASVRRILTMKSRYARSSLARSDNSQAKAMNFKPVDRVDAELEGGSQLQLDALQYQIQ